MCDITKYIECMKKWQKIIGVIIISALIIAHIWAFIDYLYLAEVAGAWCAEMTQDSFFDCIFNFKEHFWCYNALSLLDIIIIIGLFVVIWRKGGEK